MTAIVLSLNVGTPEPNPAKDVTHTGIDKRPVASSILRAPGPKHGGLGSGIEGDYIGNVEHHGGNEQAVYAFAREELDVWSERLGRHLPHGMFGENLTTLDLDVDAAKIGERWAVGAQVVLAVTGPRIPCATFQLRMGEPGWLRTFTEVGRTGAYLSVERGGTVRTGDQIRILSVPDHDIVLPLAFRAFMGDLTAAERVLAADCLPGNDADWLRARMARRRTTQSEHAQERYRSEDVAMGWWPTDEWQAMVDGVDCPTCAYAYLSTNSHGDLLAELPAATPASCATKRSPATRS